MPRTPGHLFRRSEVAQGDHRPELLHRTILKKTTCASARIWTVLREPLIMAKGRALFCGCVSCKNVSTLPDGVYNLLIFIIHLPLGSKNPLSPIISDRTSLV